MKPKQSLEWIKNFESRYGYLNYNVLGVDCWPVVRNTLLSMVLPKSSQKAGVVDHISKTSIVDLLRTVLGVFTFKKTDVFILSDTKFSEKISGAVYLKDSHVISETAKLNGETSVIALQNLAVDQAIVDKGICRSVFAVLLVAASVAKFSFLLKFFPKLSRYIEPLLSELAFSPMLADSSVSRDALKRQIYRNILFCIVASKVFSIILRCVKPKRAYVVCYYSVLGMSLCAACRKLCIPITDIQHGVAGANMRAYAGWNNVPMQGYTTLPDTFFCWTPFDAEAITQWAQLTARHRAVVIGSLWHDYIIDKFLLDKARNQWQGFFTQIDVYEKKVLVTMQSSNLTSLFSDIVRQCDSSYCFLIRMHPSFPLEKDEVYLGIVRDCSNVFFDQPSSMPIQLIMNYVDVHITEWSGAVVDAYFEGVPSVVLSDMGVDYFSDFIKCGLVFYAKNLGELKDYVSKLQRFPSKRMDSQEK